MENGTISIGKIEEDQKQFKSKPNKTTTRNPKRKSKDQLDAKKILKIFITQKTKLSNYIMIMLKLYLKLCIKQNREQELKYQLINKFFKDYQ